MPTLETADVAIPGTAGVSFDYRGTGYNPKQKVTIRVDGGSTDFVSRSTSRGEIAGSIWIGPEASLGDHRIDVYVWRKDGLYAGQQPLASKVYKVAKPPTAPPITITSAPPPVMGTTSAIVKVTADQTCSCLVEYRVQGTTTWAPRVPAETSTDRFASHEQDVQGLQSGRAYDFQITVANAQGSTAKTIVKGVTLSTPPPPSGDLPPPPSGTDAAVLINQTLQQRDVVLQSGATYVCKTPIRRPAGRKLIGNGATLLYTFIGDGILCAPGPGVVAQITLQGAHTGTGWSDNNHAIRVQGGSGHEFPDVWIHDFQGDAYYGEPSWSGSVGIPGGGTTPGSGMKITGGGFKHVGRMGLGIVAFNGGYVADWHAEDSYCPIDFEPDPNDGYQQTALHWLVERVAVRGPIRGSDGSGTCWLQMGSPQAPHGHVQDIGDIEVRYCDIDQGRDVGHVAISTQFTGYRGHDLKIHHNVMHNRWGVGARINNTDRGFVTDNVGQVGSLPWAQGSNNVGVTLQSASA